MKQTHVRNTAPMLAARRRQIAEQKADKAIETLKSLGWTLSITEHGRTITAPAEEPVKTH